MHRLLLVCCFIIGCFTFSYCAKLKKLQRNEEYRGNCNVRNRSFNNCVKQALQVFIPKIGKYGDPALDLESIDPLYIPEMVFNYDSLPDIGGKMIVNNSISTGLSNLKIISVSSDFSNKDIFIMDIAVTIPKVIVLGQFAMNGRVSLYPISGRGNFNATIGNINGKVKLRGHIEKGQDSNNYLQLNQFSLSSTINYFKIHADNVINGNSRLSRIIISFVNRFWQLLYGQTFPYFEKNFNYLARDIINRVFLKIPYDKLFIM